MGPLTVAVGNYSLIDPVPCVGVPASGANAVRKSSTSRPPPPVRRTASISSTTSAGPPVRTSPQRHLSESGGNNTAGPNEGLYAELQLIQQSIQQKKKSQQPAPPPKPGHLPRQHSGESPHPHHMSSPSPDRLSISSGSSSGSGHYAVPGVVPATSPSSASVIQSLNAKFASLNQQYQEPQFQPPLPPPNGAGTYVGGSSRDKDPGAANLMPPPVSTPGGHAAPGQPRGQVPAAPVKSGGPPPPTNPPPSRRPQGQGHPGGQGRPPQGHVGNLHAKMQQQGEGEDFPLPPTAEELAEMESMYARPPPVTPKPKLQGDLMMELKRRVSSEEASDV
ncbi:hypothetical protein ACOMHN_054001 [Nucella lapillus]